MMPGWAWLLLGLALAGVELAVVDAAFYLVFLGFAALGTGVVMALVGPGALWAQCVLFAALAVLGLALFRRKLYSRLRGNLPTVAHGLVGTVFTVDEETAPGQQTRVAVSGSRWTALNVGSSPIVAGADAHVVKVEGMRLHIEAAPTA